MPQPKPSDPKLIELATRIRTLMREYDAGGTISLVSKTHGEFAIVFPRWSGISEEPQGIRMRFKKEEQEIAEGAAHFVVSSMQVNEMFVEDFSELFDALRAKNIISFSNLDSRITRSEVSKLPAVHLVPLQD